MIALNAPYGNTLSDAFKLASERGILPTWMGSAELKELEASVKRLAVFSARTTHADYLQALRAEISKLVEGGYGSTEAEIRAALKAKMREVGYDPLTGFPGDEALGIPPARPGSLQDLSSDRRINLILDTQIQLIAGKGQQQRGMEPAALDLFPAYELVRVKRSRVPRDWLRRWKIAAENVDWEGVSREAFDVGRMIALKTSLVWLALGSSALFDDVLDVSYPPFAFGSGMGWDVRDREEAEAFGLRLFSEDPALKDKPSKVALMFADALSKQSADPALAEVMRRAAEDIRLPLPPPVKSVNGLDRDFVDALTRKIERAEVRDGKLTLQGSVDSAVQRALERRKARVNALLLELDVAALKVELNAFQRRERGRETGPKGRGKRGQVKAVKQPGKRCGKGWIASWMTCSKVSSVIGADGDAASLGLPSLRSVGKSLTMERPSLSEAKAELASKELVGSAMQSEVVFGRIAMNHFRFKAAQGDKDRARFIWHAKAVVQRPLEVWRRGMRHYYLAKFETKDGGKPFIVVTSRQSETREEVVSFHPGNHWNQLEKERSGKLLFKGYEEP